MLNFTRSIILSQILFCLGLYSYVGFAIAGPEVFILHDPVQPGKFKTVKYTATASDPQGIKSIVISVQVRELKIHNNQKISVLLSENDLKTCNYTPPFNESETCPGEDTQGYADNRHIGYKATATSGTGETSAEGYIYFAAGTYPWPLDPIPIYVRGDTAAKADLVFIPDQDYGHSNWREGFMKDVTALIERAFFSKELFAQKIRSRREMWNFYLTYEQGRYIPPCVHNPPSNWTTLRATVNSGFIVHNTPFPDCSGIGEGSLFSAEPLLPETDPEYERSLTVPIHELGHSVFSLADEYIGGGLFHLTLPEHNVFPDRNSCRENARNHGWPKQDCKKIGRTGWYRSDGPGDIMKDTSSADNAPGRSGKLRYDWHYDQCANQNC